MSVSELLQTTKTTLFSFEILPPLRGRSISQIYDTIDTLMQFNPAFIEVTTHRSDFAYRETSSGVFMRVEERLRPGTVAVACAIKQRYGVPVVPHIICSGYTQQETEYELIDLSFFDIFDLLVLRGDKAKQDNRFIPKEGGLRFANELCEQINRFNDGHLLYGDQHNIITSRPFTYGVAGYPEKHEEAMSMQADIDALKRKVDAGAGYIVTQMFYDNRKYFDYCECLAKAGIHVPVVPGIKPLGTLNHLTMLPRTFHIDFPDTLVKQLQHCRTNDEVRRVGIEWGIQQCQELKAAGAPSLHFYTMNAASAIAEIMREVG
ncbi:MAG: methylenetetrahydrofolate reductase [Bacteroidaceae bacterium]|nr:methylenetetrahydrofolate reductase [Bacteroidaceae bacterium]